MASATMPRLLHNPNAEDPDIIPNQSLPEEFLQLCRDLYLLDWLKPKVTDLTLLYCPDRAKYFL